MFCLFGDNDALCHRQYYALCNIWLLLKVAKVKADHGICPPRAGCYVATMNTQAAILRQKESGPIEGNRDQQVFLGPFSCHGGIWPASLENFYISTFYIVGECISCADTHLATDLTLQYSIGQDHSRQHTATIQIFIEAISLLYDSNALQVHRGLVRFKRGWSGERMQPNLSTLQLKTEMEEFSPNCGSSQTLSNVFRI